MKATKRNLLLLASVVCIAFGLIYAIPMLIQGKYTAGTIAIVILVVGLILLAIAWED